MPNIRVAERHDPVFLTAHFMGGATISAWLVYWGLARSWGCIWIYLTFLGYYHRRFEWPAAMDS